MAGQTDQGSESMKVEELRAKSHAELEGVLLSLRNDLFSLRMKKSTSQLRTTHELKNTKRSIARVLTVLSEGKQQNG